MTSPQRVNSTNESVHLKFDALRPKKRRSFREALSLVSKVLTGAAILVGHVDVDVRVVFEHGADDIVTALPRGPHEGCPALKIGFIFHRRVGQKHTDRLLHTQTHNSII